MPRNFLGADVSDTRDGDQASQATAPVGSLVVSDFTVFDYAKFSFSPGLNIFIGENSTGKTHILKLIYSVLAVSNEGSRRLTGGLNKSAFQARLAEKLTNVFRAERVGRLTSRRPGRSRSEVGLVFSDDALTVSFSFSTNSKTEVILRSTPARYVTSSPAYLPTRELLTLLPEFVPLYDRNILPFDETWRDTCVLLGAPMTRGPRERRIRKLLEPIEQAMEGHIETDRTGRFYLRTQAGSMEMPLVAEGLRKLGMIARLVATGTLLDNGYLLWDEPEANLNPKLLRSLAAMILELIENGIQVFIATHSLFLLREFEILLSTSRQESSHPRFFGLHRTGSRVSVDQGSTLSDVGPIASLDEDLDQSDRFLGTDENAHG